MASPYVVDKEHGLVALVITLEEADILRQVLGSSAVGEDKTQEVWEACCNAIEELDGRNLPRYEMVRSSDGVATGTWRLEERT